MFFLTTFALASHPHPHLLASLPLMERYTALLRPCVNGDAAMSEIELMMAAMSGKKAGAFNYFPVLEEKDMDETDRRFCDHRVRSGYKTETVRTLHKGQVQPCVRCMRLSGAN